MKVMSWWFLKTAQKIKLPIEEFLSNMMSNRSSYYQVFYRIAALEHFFQKTEKQHLQVPF